MKINKLLNKHGLAPSVLNTDTWKDLNEDLLSGINKERYRRIKTAIALIIKGTDSISSAARYAEIDRSSLDRALERCFVPDANGQIMGFRALAPYSRLTEYKRKNTSTSGTAGLFRDLMDKYPDIKISLLKAKKEGASYADIHEELLNNLLPNAGHPTFEYPYNTTTKGREALRKWLISQIDNTQPIIPISVEDRSPPIIRPYQQVQLDAHKCDAHFIIHLDGPDGIPRVKEVERIWLIALVDVGSRSVLGYSISLNRQCNMPDVLEAVHASVVPQNRRELTIPGLELKPGAGFPADEIPMCSWQLFDMICLDNAMAHSSERIHKVINEKTNCIVRLNKSKSPDDNAFIERFFGSLTAHGFQKTISSTGSRPGDPVAKNAIKNAITYEFTISDAEQLIYVVMANYNRDKHRGIFTSPLDYLRGYYKKEHRIVRHVPESERNNFTIKEMWDLVTVRRDGKDVPNTYIQYLDAKYRGNGLPLSMTNKKVLVLININDLGCLKAYSQDGQHLCDLKVTGRWSLAKHSLKTRQLIIKLAREKEIIIGYKNPVLVLNDYPSVA